MYSTDTVQLMLNTENKITELDFQLINYLLAIFVECNLGKTRKAKNIIIPQILIFNFSDI